MRPGETHAFRLHSVGEREQDGTGIDRHAEVVVTGV
jgi:hypothetical protein